MHFYKKISISSLTNMKLTWVNEKFIDKIKLKTENNQSINLFKNHNQTLCRQKEANNKIFFSKLVFQISTKRYEYLDTNRALHRYIQTEMEFLDISSLGVAYRYAVKIEQKFRIHNKLKFVPANP
jgi:hypothetical protein